VRGGPGGNGKFLSAGGVNPRLIVLSAAAIVFCRAIPRVDDDAGVQLR